MKINLFLICLFMLSFGQINAQKKTNPIVNYTTNAVLAKENASKNKQHILMVFGGSDWCAPCIKFKKKVLQSDAFNAYAKDNLQILYLDFPSRKKNRLSKEQTAHNEALAEVYNQEGAFPKIVLAKADGTVIRVIKYNGQSAKDFMKKLKK